MGFKRQQITRVDKSTQKIVDELRALHFTVVYVGRPTDLLVRHPKWGPNRWRLLECKSHKDAKGNVKLDKRQQEQQDFCKTHGVPYVTDVFEALLALGEVIEL
jgi:hypothetical protein